MKLILMLIATLNLSILSRVGFDTIADKILFWFTAVTLVIYLISLILHTIYEVFNELIGGEKK